MILLALCLSGNVLADSSSLAPCSKRALGKLVQKANLLKTQGLEQSKIINNGSLKPIGIFVWSEKDIHVEVCESFAGNSWSNWDSKFPTAPAQWKRGQTYAITEDGSVADIFMDEESSDGNIAGELVIHRDEVLLKRDAIIFSDLN